jgi:hypothetical protein
MATCIYCGTEYSLERQQCGYDYCLSDECRKQYKIVTRYGANKVVMLMPKQGYMVVDINSDDLKHGRSSGR